MKTTLWTALGTALLVLWCGVPIAAADSLAYIKAGNVWLATPDGARQVQVTAGGGYSDVSQADDGTMIALKGVRLQRLDRLGNVLADFDTPVSDAHTTKFSGPFDPALSPDGTKVAYTYTTGIGEGGTGYSHADRRTEWDEPGFGYTLFWRHPAWIDDDLVLLGDPTHLPNADVILDRVSDGGNSAGNPVMDWFSDTIDNPHVGGGDSSRDQRKLAFQTGAGDDTLTLYSVRDQVGGEVRRCYRYAAPAGQSYSPPTFSPDGAGLAFALADGVHVARVPDFSGGCTRAGATDDPPLVIAGGSQPDWGPADVPAAPATTPAPAPPAPPAQVPAVQPMPVAAPPVFSASVAVARHVLQLSVTVPGPGRLSATALAGRRTVGKAARTVRAAGTASLKLPVTKKGRVKVKVAFKPASGASVAKTLSVTVR